MSTFDRRDAERRARVALDRRDPTSAVDLLLPLLRAPLNDEFPLHLRLIGQAFNALENERAAAAVGFYLRDTNVVTQVSSHPRDLARAATLGGDHRAAARHYEEALLFAHAAFALERAGDDRGARVLWERFVATPRVRADSYAYGLGLFNLGRAAQRLGDQKAGKSHVVHAMHALSAAADSFEQLGLRERAFDCYLVLIAIGRTGSFEDLAEGYLNCIRILREDGLKLYVQRYSEDFQALAMQRNELHAAATLYREAAEYARKVGLPSAARYRELGAEAYVLAGEQALARGAPPEMVENAFIAAIDAYNELALYSKVREIYGRLTELALPPTRTARYARLSSRLATVPDGPAPSPMTAGSLHTKEGAYPSTWVDDVIEFELDGDVAETMADVVVDPRASDNLRQAAITTQLTLWAEGSGSAPRAATYVEALRSMKAVTLYVSLAPVERLARHPDTSVRAAAMQTVKQYLFKRSFVTVRQGLADRDELVRAEALRAISSFKFGHAIDPLIRIHREASVLTVREVALRSIGAIGSADAAEYLVDVLRHGSASERTIVREALAGTRHGEVRAVIERAAALEVGPARDMLQTLLR